MRIFNLGNNAVNLYLADSGTHRLLIDSGFPGQLHETGRQMRKTGFRIQDIDFVIVTHFHVDHAGNIQALIREGVPFILMDVQTSFIHTMEEMISDKWKHYLPLDKSKTIHLPVINSRAFLKKLNINGECVHTPGHSDDSISLVLDSGEAFTGDLPAEHLLSDADIKAKTSWMKLKQLGVTSVYPGHGNKYDLL